MKKIGVNQIKIIRDSISFEKYLRDIYKIKLFTPEEEIACTNKIKLGDKEAIDELVKRNLRFVVSVAKQYSNKDILLEDLVNEGNIGLIMAAKKFDPEFGVKFISYAVWFIQKTIIEYHTKYSRMIRLPANKINDLSILNKQIEKLEQKLGRTVDIIEIIDEYGTEDYDGNINNQKFELLEILNSDNITSLDMEIGNDDDGSTTLKDLISDDYMFKPTDYLLVNGNIKSEINNVTNRLNPRDKYVITSLYGLDGSIPLTLQEIGSELGLTREMARQIKIKALKKLKNYLNYTLS